MAPNNILYGLGKLDGNLYVINPNTGGDDPGGERGGQYRQPHRRPDVWTDGTLYATLDDTLYTLSTTTGLATEVGSSDPTVYTGLMMLGHVMPPGMVHDPDAAGPRSGVRIREPVPPGAPAGATRGAARTAPSTAPW